MQRWRVDSSMILAINYDTRQKLLELELHNGAIWLFRDVPRALVQDMLAASSKGKFYNRWLRDLFTKEVIRDYAGREVLPPQAMAS